MNRLINNIILVGLVLVAFSCVTPENPTPTQMAYGNWIVDEYYVNGQADGSSVLQRFTLEKNGSFVMEDNNSVLTVGTWTATDTSITLVGEGEDALTITYTIVFQSYSKMQLLQTIESPTIGDIEIRYLMNWQNANTY